MEPDPFEALADELERSAEQAEEAERQAEDAALRAVRALQDEDWEEFTSALADAADAQYRFWDVGGDNQA